MAEIVAGYIMPHAPHLCAAPDQATPEQRRACTRAFATIANQIRELRVDTVIIIGDDHYTIHGPQCLPSALIGIGDIEGPAEPWLNMPRTRIANDPDLARHIARYGLDNGVDWSIAKAMVLDHSIYVPYHHAVRPVEGVKMIPVYLNAGVEPYISSRRCHEIGQSIRRAVDACAASESRIAIYGTGGFSHWPGLPRMGEINGVFDTQMLALLAAGDVNRLIALSDDQVLSDGGNGGLELKNWICAFGAFGRCRTELLTYQAISGYSCGCGYLKMQGAA